MSNRVVHKVVLWKHALVATLHMLVLLCEALIAKSFLIYVFNLTCYDIDPFVVVFVNG